MKLKELYKGIMTKNKKNELSKFGIYAIINLSNGKTYIGSTRSTFCSRWAKHSSELRNNQHKNSYLQNSWNKYGMHNFEFKILEILESSQIKNIYRIEQKYINKFNSMQPNGYNLIVCDTSINIEPTSESTIKKMKKGQEKIKNQKTSSYFKISQFDSENILDMFFSRKYSIEYIINLYNIEIEIFNQLISFKDVNKIKFGDNYFDIFNINKTSHNKSRKNTYCRERCIDCFYYYNSLDYCDFYKVNLPNNHILTCNDQILVLNENDFEEVNELQEHFGLSNIDDLNEKFFDGGI